MAATTIASFAMINAKFPNPTNTKLITSKPTSLLSIQNLPKGLSSTKPTNIIQSTKLSIEATAIAGAIFSTLGACDPAYAVQQIAELAEGSDNRGIALLLPIIPAIAWVLFNILQPALNQINRMRNKDVILGFGVGGLASYLGLVSAPDALASEIGMIAEAAANDNRGKLLLLVVSPAILWVLYNILQPALNQINRMRSK
ncbi:hypothetical protein TanjilG_05721 [Lupinus angustifolius]|uniref:Photosystem II core complex proteins psbY n=1 Tax=Lupinus angustifolius TaxID=3871 RepID=A0A4P1R3E7_LUPAN|nr:PREDICTED: photosystem II core complex proteins psbY, chloroplastic-like [Lupinus angustifolius]OIW00371.1 hypothetical protein TanjilG_05721 [Lupinus angustifolius]